MNKTIQRVSYLPMPEMQFEYFKDRIAEVMCIYYPEFSFSSICDSIECYEIMRYKGCPDADEWFSLNGYDTESCVDKIKKNMSKLILNSQKNELIDTFLSMDIYLAKAFLEVVSEFNLFNSFDGDCLSTILSKKPYYLRDVLRLPRMVNKFKNQIRNQMLMQADSAECILELFVGKADNHSPRINLPDTLSKADINTILLNYLNSGKANL